MQTLKESNTARRRRLTSERGRRMARARWRKEVALRESGQFVREETYEDLVARAKWDRKGSVILEGCTYSATAINPWQLRWSLQGRSDQLDLLFSGRVVFTGGRRRLRRLAPWLRL